MTSYRHPELFSDYRTRNFATSFSGSRSMPNRPLEAEHKHDLLVFNPAEPGGASQYTRLEESLWIDEWWLTRGRQRIRGAASRDDGGLLKDVTDALTKTCQH